MNARRAAWALFALLIPTEPVDAQSGVGSERAIAHVTDGEEFATPQSKLLKHGRALFVSKWTSQDGMGRPLAKGTGALLSDLTDPLVFPRNFNRVSSPESTSCGGCHADPRPGGGGEFFTNVFAFAQRFDHATFDRNDFTPTKGALDEGGNPVRLENIGNLRATPSLFGAGYVERLAIELTLDLLAIRDGITASSSAALVSKGISFGVLARAANGAWDVSLVEGLPASSLQSSGPLDPPNLIVRPFGHVGSIASIRQFSAGAFEHHLGIQAIERVGVGTDPDGDLVVDELTRADLTAISLFQATLPVPGRVIPKDPAIRAAISLGEQTFVDIGCTSCHVPCLPLDSDIFSEPNPFNPAGVVNEGDAYHVQFGSFSVDLSSKALPRPRLKSKGNAPIEVPVFSDFRLHDITSGLDDPNREPIDVTQPPGSAEFLAGNARFLTARLWGVANGLPYFHHGKFTTMREAIEAHAGEAAGVMIQWGSLSGSERDAVIEFLKSLRILEDGEKHAIVDEKGKKVKWPKFPWTCGQEVPPP